MPPSIRQSTTKKKPPQAPPKEGMQPTGCYVGFYKRTDEGVCPYFWISIGIGENYPNQLPLGTPPLWGGWVGFPDEGVCPYFEKLHPTKQTTCLPVNSSTHQLHLTTCLPVNLSTRQLHLTTCLPVNSSTRQLHLTTCLPVNSSTCQLHQPLFCIKTNPFEKEFQLFLVSLQYIK